MYSDNDLSRMHSKISKKWRKKWDKDESKRTFTADTIDRLVAKHESIVELEAEEEKNHEKSLLQSSQNDEQLQNLSTCSDWFNTTRDEMILFEKFGEEYDVIGNSTKIHQKKTKRKKIMNFSSEFRFFQFSCNCSHFFRIFSIFLDFFDSAF